MNPKFKTERRALYPGSFDPITNGHIDIIQRSLHVFDEVIVLIAKSGKKRPLFDVKDRQEMVERCFENEPRVSVALYDGLLVDFARNNQIRVVVRGLRAVSDFDYEFQMATINRRMYPELQEFFLMASEKFFFVNSSLVKEVIGLNGKAEGLVPEHVEKRIREKLC